MDCLDRETRCAAARKSVHFGHGSEGNYIIMHLHENLFTLVTDQKGNYMIKHVIEHGLPEDRETRCAAT
uniref:PUM-HD domain-containing protein n=1 Tax=Globodera rostochiensis TaxID=31243 RepID=A0A914HZR7_GLORO